MENHFLGSPSGISVMNEQMRLATESENEATVYIPMNGMLLFIKTTEYKY